MVRVRGVKLKAYQSAESVGKEVRKRGKTAAELKSKGAAEEKPSPKEVKSF